MQITAYDYIRDRAGPGPSLARIATLIAQARADARAAGRLSLLLDNGDLLQGTPLARYIAKSHAMTENPVALCLNQLNYDAAGLGNHDFDHGTKHLSRTLAQYRMPVLCTNLHGTGIEKIEPSVILTRIAKCSDGSERALQIGLASVLPQQTISWNRQHLSGKASVTPPLDALRATVSELRANGADIVVVLAHMGIALFDEGDAPQNEVIDVAALEGVDAVIGGHTHLCFPGTDHTNRTEADNTTGLIHGKPVVLPGSSGSHLGMIELDVQWSEGGRAPGIARAASRLIEVSAETPEAPEIRASLIRSHEATRGWLSAPVGRLTAPMNSYFALAHPSPVPALIAATQKRVIERAVAGTKLAQIPLLSVGSTASTGGFDGPDNFISFSAGVLQRRHIAGLNPYANLVWAVHTTGAGLIDWLERSALIFNTLVPDSPEQSLTDLNIPGFRYDAIYGITYEIDLTQPPSYDPAGRPSGNLSGRIFNVRWQNEPLDPEQEFLVATSDHRTGGGGALKAFTDSEIAFRGKARLQQGLIEYLKAPDCSSVRAAVPWRFSKTPGMSAILLTAPAAKDHLQEISHLSPEFCGMTADGFARVRLHL